MATPLLECVPNISEGRSPERIAAISAAFCSVSGVYLLHQDSGYDAHRTVLTLAGAPEALAEAAFRGIEACARLLDMRSHRGEHPRIGAADVVPFIPLRGVTETEAIEHAHALGHRVGEELGLPVYYYGAAALRSERESLANVRKGGYEALSDRLTTPQGAPDAGPAAWIPSFGAVAIGVRPVLIAFNINLGTKDVELAKRIARQIRTRGWVHDGQKIPGLLPSVRAIGWWMPQYDCAQVSLNLLDYRITGLKTAYDTVAQIAQREGTHVKGSELIGLVPWAALAVVAKSLGLSSREEEEQIQAVENYLGLSACKLFQPEDRILERVLGKYF